VYVPATCPWPTESRYFARPVETAGPVLDMRVVIGFMAAALNVAVFAQQELEFETLPDA
jgi:hypothetical protein